MTLSVAILAHSTNPRGGVVHALELADALTALGHHAVVHAPDPAGRGFFRTTRCATVGVPARPVPRDAGLRALVEARIADYVAFFAQPGAARFDLYHAQDGISGNALADLHDRGRISGYLYTVHHIDGFGDPVVDALQLRAIRSADRVLCVSRLWRDALVQDHGIDAAIVGNGVDRSRFTPVSAAEDVKWRSRLGLTGGPVFLSVGGVEARKNSVRILDAFREVRHDRPDAQLVVAGGASLLDHSPELLAFEARIAADALPTGPGGAIIRTGPFPDAAMPALYRLADALVFPSLREGFGLAVLEAMACGTPTIVPAIAPFTEHLEPGDALWVDPLDGGDIARAMLAVLEPRRAQALRAAGLARAAGFGWEACAARHVAEYTRFPTLRRSLSHA
ncbi:MSMEG_0565 family glycosyltransferase [Azospirillum sp. YIM B02556]|uniref:MSMEG_0565 family glycosyltransferase n=1 Tax=Azospirillum endophyticum TaxID=2800326 RepID=A0ABS1FA72_9PROT|nr:MSMEG_0565 family glycosyltransferase [Azospirillum endophyticum]MBK1840320.1 MSMEG_0565 family glycosyltransferase [Azospirillum endophyticum]